MTLNKSNIAAARSFILSSGLWLVWLGATGWDCAGASSSLQITNLPSYGSAGYLGGCVLGGDPARQAVAVFIYVPGYGWVSKPNCSQPLTPLKPDGSWSANITTGGSDANATRVAALLVGTNYNQPCVLGEANLSSNVYAQAIAKAVITRPSPGVRFLTFSGYDWWVKNSSSAVGPGPNYFSEATNNVWTDTNGWLHLRITYRSNQWQCAEIVSAQTFGLGSYRFELNSVVDNIDPNVTLGLFTWSDDPVFTYREMDVECGRWNSPADTNNSQFVLQPYYAANHLVRYRTPAGLSNSTHLFIWETNRISYQSQVGAFTPSATNLISSYFFTNGVDIPLTGDENVHLNYWLQWGNPPTDNQESEFVIKGFSFVPQGTPPPAVQVTVNPSEAWVGFMNVTELPANGGAYDFGTGWATADLAASFSGKTLTLTPNTSIDRDDPTNAYWWVGGTGGAPNKIMDAVMYVESDGLAGQTISFTGYVLTNNLANPYSCLAFIRDFVPDFSAFTQIAAPVVSGSRFNISMTPASGHHVQYGFETTGPDARLATVAALGRVQVTGLGNPFALMGLTWPGDGPFHFGFTNLAGASFTVFGTTNLALPINLWSNLGAPVESPAGQFQFTDPEATKNVRRFYRVHSP